MLVVLIFLVLFSVSCAQQNADCETKETCHECIQQLGCSWCINPKPITPKNKLVHCMKEDTAPPNWCNNPFSPKIPPVISINKPLSNAKGNVIQLKPQKIKINLRKNEEYKFDFVYKQAENYPVDLYYIMDLSKSMEKHKIKLGNLGISIANTMRKLTNNFKLGFGSFVDKPDLPYISTAIKYNARRIKPYSFKNHLSLTEDYSKFNHEVLRANISENVDSPEGGFDAIMQAIVCKDEIEWREHARHLIVFSTDALFHMAGDGKLAGVVLPSDGKCHMENNEYTESLVYDYPSISHINYVAKMNNINLVFAVSTQYSSNVNESYTLLSAMIENSNVGILDNESKNVLKLITDNYNRIVDSVTMTSNASNDVDIKFTSTCKHPIENGCTRVHVGDVINFSATIRVLECSKDKPTKKIISIKPQALAETITVELDVACSCGCEDESHPSFRRSSPNCNRHGDLECGVCHCHRGYYGKNCECDGVASVAENSRGCQQNQDGPICSGLGVCYCGQCKCGARQKPEEKIYGRYCECNNYNCNRVKGTICAGHGTCDCGECVCNSGWTGDACECSASNSTCILRGATEVCSGHGTCSCGACSCNVDRSGKYCEECTSCPSQRCEELRHCVECQSYNSGVYDKNQCDLKCTSFETIIVSKFNDTFDASLKKCRLLDKNGCRIIFEYTYEKDDLVVRALKDKVCTAPPNIWAWIGGVIGTILIAGLILLVIWKICTSIHDKREYVKFEEERRKMMWGRDDNPLYKNPSNTFSNPAYGRRSMRLSS